MASRSVMTTASSHSHYQVLLIGPHMITMPTNNPLIPPAYHPMTRLPSVSLPHDTLTLFLHAITRRTLPRIHTVPRIAIPVLLLSFTPITHTPSPHTLIPSSPLGFRILPPIPSTAARHPRIPSHRRCLLNRHGYCRRASKTRTRRSK